ncbi:hypothetical protein [Segatella copri]|jgi:hypothetical protein|uniref:PorT family protein n=1 Tax=Segatella copri TaxID=165179 RepID=A0A3R6E479_9BACT|nr:hypothetical protein [Segatella copri]RHG34610.1 hypothetical protein DW263_05960 [Segatella copri]RHG36088.1 hypothetical protein DW262_08060 [Segatella copri]RHG66493.1 hypothetical protein DW250_06295 [Segatella copri]
MKKLMMVAVILLTSVGSVMAQSDYKRGIFNHVGLNVGAGTEGISVGVAAPVTNFLEVEAGVNIMPSFKLSGDLDVDINMPQESDIQYPTSGTIHAEGSFDRTTFNVKANLYPFGGGSKFFIAAGLSIGGEKIAEVTGSCDELRKFSENNLHTPELKDQFRKAISANLGGYNLELDENYNLQGDIRCKNVRPYLGLGFGRLVPKNRIGCRLELGCQFMGKLKVYQNGNEIDINKALEDAGEDDLSKFVKDLKVYPVLKFSLTGRIL